MKPYFFGLVVTALAALISPSALAHGFSTSDGKGKSFEIAMRIEGVTFSQVWPTIKPGDYRGQFCFDCDTNGWLEKHSVNYRFTLWQGKAGMTMTGLEFYWKDNRGDWGQKIVIVQDGPPDFTPTSTWEHHFAVRACYIDPLPHS